ncbi:MAG: glycine--tRNA ligase [Candidatus Pacearchaeota archaeon]
MFIVKKRINGKEYYYARTSKREKGKIKSITIAYLGKTKEEAEKNFQKILKEFNEKNKMEEIEKENKIKLTIEELASFCKRKSFIFKSSEIYGGLSGFWDYGPLGAELFNNLKKDFLKFFLYNRDDMVFIEASIISHPKTWYASGHVSNFQDFAAVCKKCKKAIKLDKSEINNKKCDCGGNYELLGNFNLMFKTNVGALNPIETYLRPETAQGMFLNFKNIYETSRVKLPFGILQIGKCFRNEISPRDFIFRSREFTIGEFEFFINPNENKCNLLDEEHLNLRLKLLDKETQEAGKEEIREVTIKEMIKEKRLEEWHAYWLAEQIMWFNKLNLIDNIRVREHKKDELSHYSSATFDIDYEFPFGILEIAGIANRGQYDLTQHEKESKEKLSIYDEKTKLKIIPKVIEPTFGMDRIFLAIICKGYEYDEKRENIVLKIPSYLAPIKAAIFPIVKNENYEKLAKEIYKELKKEFNVFYDDSASIGRRYARQDEIGTPYCVTVDEESITKKDCTIRDRDTTQQIRVDIKDLKNTLKKLIEKEIKFEDAGKIVNTRKKI